MYIHNLAIKRQKKGPMQPVRSVRIDLTEGIIGDCRGRGGILHRRQVTVISLEQWHEACQEIGKDLPSWTRRANICISGHSFGPDDVGKFISPRDGKVMLQITGETKPCHRMDEIVPGLRKALEPNWRGGVTCSVVSSGDLSQDDHVEIL